MFISSFTYDNLTLNSVTLNWVWDITSLNFSAFTLRRGNADILLTGLNSSNLINSFTDSNLNPGTNYIYYLFNDTYIFILDITTHNVPEAVTHAYVSYVKSYSARIEWFAPISDNGSNIINYEISLNNNIVDHTMQLYYEFNDLTPNSEYEIAIKSVNEYGPAQNTKILNFNTKVDLPKLIDSSTINFNEKDNILTWIYAQDDVWYLVQRRDNIIPFREIYRGLDTYFVEPYNLSTNKEYQYRIKATNRAGSSDWVYSDPIQISEPDVINDIELVSSIFNQGIVINIISELTPDYYEYRVSTDNGLSWFLDWSSIESDTSSIVLSGLDVNSVYLIEVRAVNESGSGTSKLILVNLNQLPPSVPFGLTYSIDLFPEYRIIFNWSDQVTWNDNGVDKHMYSYDLLVGDQQLVGVSDINSYIYNFTENQFNEKIQFKVKSINNNGLSSLMYSDILSLTIPSVPKLTVVPVTVAATMVSFNISTVYNDDAFTNTSHRTTAEFKPSVSNEWSESIIVSDHIDIPNLKQNTTYDFRFKAYNVIAASDYELLSLTTAAAIDDISAIKLSPNAVTNLRYRYRESHYIVINYDKSVNATHYEISILDNLNSVLESYQTDSSQIVLRRVSFDFALNSYRIAVRSFNDDVPGGTSVVVLQPDITVPSTPISVEASVLNFSSLQLTWENATDSDVYSVLINVYVNNKESTIFISDYSNTSNYIVDLNSYVEIALKGKIRTINYKLCSVDHFGNLSEPFYGSIAYSSFRLSLMPVLNLKAILDSNRLEYIWDYAKYSRMTSIHLDGIESDQTTILPAHVPIQSIYFKVGQFGSDYGFKDNNLQYQFNSTNRQSILSADGDILLFYSASYYGDVDGVLPDVLFDGNHSLASREIDEISWNIINRKFTIRTNGNIKWAPISRLLNYWGQILHGEDVVYQFNFGGLGHNDWVNLTDGVNLWSASNVLAELNNYVGKELILVIYRGKPDIKPNLLESGRVIYGGLEPNTFYNLSVTGHDALGNDANATRPAYTLPRIAGARRSIKSMLQFLYYYDANADYIYNLFARQLGETDYTITNFNDMAVDVTYEIKCEEINRNGSVKYSYYRLDPDNNIKVIRPGSMSNLRFTRSMTYSITYSWTEYDNSSGYYVVLTNPDNSEIIYDLPAYEPYVTYFPDNGKIYSISLQVKDAYGNLTRPYYDEYTVPNSPGILSGVRVSTFNSSITAEWDKPTHLTHYQTLLELYRNGVLVQTKYLDSDAVTYTFSDLLSGKYVLMLRSLNSVGYYTTTYNKHINLSRV